MSALAAAASVLVSASLLLAEAASAQSVCRPADAAGNKLVARVATYRAPTNSKDAVVRDSLRLGAVSLPSQVTLVAQEAVCKKAKAAYEAEFSGRGGSTFSGRVYVVKSGSTYAVFDPDYHYQNQTDIWIVMVMDDRYRKLSLF